MNQSRCTACATALRPNARFCPECGKPVIGPLNGDATRVVTTTPVPAAGPGVVPRPRAATVLRGPGDADMVVGWLLVVRGPGAGRDFRLRRSSTTIGRDATCEVQLADETVSREHARLRVTAESARVADLGSSNGTFVNGERVTEANLLDGDVVTIGSTFLLFRSAVPRVELDAIVERLPEGNRL